MKKTFVHAAPFSATQLLGCAAAAVLLLATGPVQAQSSVTLIASSPSAGPAVYPAKGQSAKQQDRDTYECHGWAKRQSGFDPVQAAQASPAGMPPGGMLRGVVGGAAIGELAHDDPGRGAAVGALGAAMRERVKQGQAQQARSQQRAGYDRAFAACLEGRGYTVK